MKKYIKKSILVLLSSVILTCGVTFALPQITDYSCNVNAAEITDNIQNNDTFDNINESKNNTESNTPIIRPERIELDKSDITIQKGKTIFLTAKVFPENADDKNISWTSSDESIVSVSQGKLIAVSEGTANITAETSNGITAICKVTVTVPEESIKLSQTSLTIEKGKTKSISAKVLPENSSDKSIIWTSSDENVAVVSDGVIMAVSGGTADITAASANGLTASCHVTVTVPAESIVISQTSITLQKGESFTLVAKVYPNDTTNKTVIWSSSDSTIVSVNGGKIKAKSAGTAIITAKTVNEKSASYTVRVVIMPTGIKLNKSSLTLQKGKSQTVKATLNPTNTTEKNIKWTTSNSKVAAVSNGKITAKSVGTATITASTVNGQTAKCTVKVIINPTSVKLNKNSLLLGKGKNYQLKATIYPKNATDKKIKWTSSNNKVLTVSNGKITAKSVGTAVITVKTSNGKTAKCTVKVEILPTKIKLNKSEISIEKGKSYTLKATITPNNVTNKKITWTSTNTKIATVKNGKITAKNTGTTTITAKTSNGKKISCKVNVRIYPKSIKLNKTSVLLQKGKSTTLKATIAPNNATLKNIKWTSSNSKIITVKNGKISAKQSGTATVTAVTSNGKKASCKVTVKVAPTKISLDKTSISIKTGSSVTLKAKITPTGKCISTLTWTSSNNDIALVKNGKVTAKKAGNVVITAKTVNGKTAKTKVKIYIVNCKKAYTPDQVYKDISYLKKSYPDIIKVSSIGKSVQNRDIKLIQLGKGKKKALIVGGIHSREHITVSYVMRVIEEYADAYKNNRKYGEYNIRTLLNKYTLYIVPMSNPDGTQIANTKDKPLYIPDYFKNDSFKGNANAVNLNRNFPYYWEGVTDGIYKNQTNYRGTSSASEPETKAIIKLCNNNKFQFLLDMHILGGGIYWRDEGNGNIPNDYKLASAISKKCGYLLFENTTIESGYAGGLENWFRYAYNKPGLCIEMIPFNQYYLSDTYKEYNKYFEQAVEWSKTKYTFAEAMKIM